MNLDLDYCKHGIDTSDGHAFDRIEHLVPRKGNL